MISYDFRYYSVVSCLADVRYVAFSETIAAVFVQCRTTGAIDFHNDICVICLEIFILETI